MKYYMQHRYYTQEEKRTLLEWGKLGSDSEIEKNKYVRNMQKINKIETFPTQAAPKQLVRI